MDMVTAMVTATPMGRNKRHKKAARFAACTLALAGFVPAVEAAEWTIVPRVNVEETFSDNVGLQPSGSERGELITSVEPGVAIRGEGSRFQVSVEYNLEALKYLDNDDADTINHQAQVGASAEIYENLAFVDMNMSMSQQNSDTLGITASDNLSITGNKTDVMTFSVSPYLRHHIGNYFDTESRITVDQVTNDTDGNSTRSRSRRAQFTATSGNKFLRAPWNVRFESQRLSNSDGSTSKFNRLDGEVRYRISRRYALIGQAGFEDNEFTSSQNSQDGPSWAIGLNWTPTPRTNIDFGYGQRFFDGNFFLQAQHRTRRLTFAASYRKDLTTSRQLQLERVLVPVVDDSGLPILDPASGTQIEVPVDSVNPTDEVLVQANFDASIRYRGRRTDGQLEVFRSERKFQVSSNENIVSGLRLQMSRRISRRGTVSVSGLAQLTEDKAVNQEDTRLQLNLRYAHTLGQNFRATAGLAHVTQDSNLANNDFDENRLTVGLLATF